VLEAQAVFRRRHQPRRPPPCQDQGTAALRFSQRSGLCSVFAHLLL